MFRVTLSVIIAVAAAEHEAEAAMATELYCLLAENATDMVSTHHPDGRFAYAAQTWSEFVGVPILADASLYVAKRRRAAVREMMA